MNFANLFRRRYDNENVHVGYIGPGHFGFIYEVECLGVRNILTWANCSCLSFGKAMRRPETGISEVALPRLFCTLKFQISHRAKSGVLLAASQCYANISYSTSSRYIRQTLLPMLRVPVCRPCLHAGACGLLELHFCLYESRNRSGAECGGHARRQRCRGGYETVNGLRSCRNVMNQTALPGFPLLGEIGLF